MDSLIRTSGLIKSYGNFTLGPIDLTLPKGYIMGLIGENGAGKTTLIRLLLQLLRQDDGEVSVLGSSKIADSPELLARIGFVFDAGGYYGSITAEENAKFFALSYPNWDEDKFHQYARQFELPLRKKLDDYSQGMKSRFRLAVALSHATDLLILDEPTSGLDPVFRRKLLALLQEYIEDGEKSVLFSTHITSDLEGVADYISFIRQGRLIVSGEKDAILEEYHLIKGPSSSWSTEWAGCLIGVQHTGVGFVGLCRGVPSRTEGLVIEKPTLEDFMFHHSEEGK